MYPAVNHRTVIVGIAVGAGLIVIFFIGCTIWCCYCRGRKARARKMQQQEDEYQSQRDAIADKHQARLVCTSLSDYYSCTMINGDINSNC